MNIIIALLFMVAATLPLIYFKTDVYKEYTTNDRNHVSQYYAIEDQIMSIREQNKYRPNVENLYEIQDLENQLAELRIKDNHDNAIIKYKRNKLSDNEKMIKLANYLLPY